MKNYLFLIFLGSVQWTFAQTWSDNVASIVYNKCSKCHHDDGIAPFSLMTYEEASAMSSSIRDAIVSNEMPPYPPDESFQVYAHSRALDITDKQTVIDWVDNGAPEGNSANTPPLPVFPEGSLLGNGDLVLQMPVYMSKALGSEDYACFSIPSNLLQDRKIKALEIVPGNRAIVHHCLVFADETGDYETDTIGGDCSGPPDGKLLMAYTPGSSPLILPNGQDFKLGMTLTAGSNIVFAMHYPSGSYGEMDSTKVIFHFYPQTETGVREVSVASVLQNWNIALPPEEVTTLTAQYPPSGGLPVDFSILSVFPHMHLLGKEIKAYALDTQNDTIPFIHIPEWDFHWQDFYFFRNALKAPAGSVIKGYAVYDNTSANPENPNNPPEFVFAGESTTDEMFLVYFHYMLYQPGDENYDLEDLMSLGVEDYALEPGSILKAHPNPFTESISFSFRDGSKLSEGRFHIYDTQGNFIRELIPQDQHTLSWDGKNAAGKELAPGVYFISVNHKGNLSHQTLVKH